MHLKPGVTIQGIRPELLFALLVADGVWRDLSLPELTVTSLLDGEHSRNSLHYLGCAADLRTRNISPYQIPQVIGRLKERLGDTYDIIAETNHIHVEYQPHKPL